MLSFNKTQILSETSLSSRFINRRDFFFLKEVNNCNRSFLFIKLILKAIDTLRGKSSVKMRSRIILQYKTDRPILMQEVYKGTKQINFIHLINLSA